MRDFIKSLRFKILVAIVTMLLGFMIMAVYTGETAPLFSQIASFVTVPVQRVSAQISYSVSGFFDKFFQSGQLYEENERLRQEINELREKLVDYDQTKHENEQLRAIMGAQDIRPG